MILITRLLALAIFCVATGVAAQPSAEKFIDALEAADITAVEAALKRGESPVKAIAYPSAPAYAKSPMRWLLGGWHLGERRPEVIDAKKVKVARLLTARGAKVEPNDETMYVAVAKGHAGVVKLLLDANQDIHRRLGGYLPTELAALRGHEDLYKVLVARGGKALAQHERTQLMLMRGVSKRDRDLVAMAIEAGADVNAHDPAGQTALTELLAMPILDRDRDVMEEDLEFMWALIETWKAHPAIPSVGDSPTYPIIQWVRMNSFSSQDMELSGKIISALVRFGADVNVVDFFKQTALHVAAEQGNGPAAEALVKAGINHKTMDFRGRTALDLASDPAMRALLKTLPATARAEKFVEVHRSDLTGDVILVDTESFATSKFKQGTELRYRTKHEATVLQYTAVAFCNDFSILDIKVEGVAPTYTFPVREFYKESTGSMDGVDLMPMMFTEEKGKVIAAACTAANPEAIDRLLAPPPQAECFDSKDAFTKAICESGGDARGNIALLKARSERVAAACGQDAFVRAEFQALMVRVAGSACGGRESCNRVALRDMAVPVNRDFAALIRWEARGSPSPFPATEVCKASVSLRVAASETQRRRDAQAAEDQARAKLLACAKAGAQRLDDRRSDAKVISDAAIESCSKERSKLTTVIFNADPQRDALSGKVGVETELLQFVLENRAKTRKN